MQYPVEHGRQYHAYKDGVYTRPNDDAELDRLDLMHAMMYILYDGKLHLAPIHNSHRVLDVGAGSGIWCIDFADIYASAEILGVDLSANLPTFVPPNVRFEVDDLEDDWTFAYPFDYIHSRYMAGSIKDWPRLMQQCFENIRPGGWVEFQDFDIDYYSQDGSLSKTHAMRRWLDIAYGAEENTQRSLRPGPKIEGWVRDAGFTNVQVVKNVLPLGTWPKDPKLKMIGRYNWIQLYEGLQAMSLRLFTRFLGWAPEDVEMLLLEVRKDLRDPKIHAMFDHYTVWGQRPAAAQ